MARRNKIKDIDIRKEFINRNEEFLSRNIFVNEFKVSPRSIVDLASFDVVNNIFYGFEIKSEADNLKRLERQLLNYINLFHVVYVITHSSHLEGVFKIISKECFKNVGIIEVSSSLDYTEVKKAKKNEIKPLTLLNLLTRDSLERICESLNIPTSKINKRKLRSHIGNKVSINILITELYNKLNRYYIKTCEVCNSNLYYNKRISNISSSICYKCNNYIINY